MRVIIIGAGISGLAALHELEKHNIDAVCLEAGDIPGGRVVSNRRDGFILDEGAQFYFRFYDTIFGLARELGLHDQLTTWPFRAALWNRERLTPVVASVLPKDLWQNKAELIRFVLSQGVPYSAALQLLKVIPTLAMRFKDLDFIDFERMLDMDDESLADFIRAKGGDSVLENVFGPVGACMTLAHPEDIGAGYGLALLWNMINGLWTMQQGIAMVPEALAQKYSERIRLNTRVDKIVIEKGKVKGVEIDGQLMEADAVIPAVTATTLLEIAPDLPETMRRPVSAVEYSACCHVMFGLNRPLLKKGWYAVVPPRATGSTMAGFTESSVKSQHYVPTGCGLIHCFTYGKHAQALNRMSDKKVNKALIDDVRRFVPAMPDNPVFTRIRRWDEAVCTAPAGMLRQIAGLKASHLQDIRGLHLAGDYLYMPSVNGSARSGIDAAKALVKQA